MENIKIDLKETGLQDGDWIHMAQNKHANLQRAIVNTALKLRVPLVMYWRLNKDSPSRSS
jgi:hypothetical protein